MRRYGRIGVILTLILCAGCTAVPAPSSLSALKTSPTANRLPLKINEDGLMIIPVSIGESKALPFILDTGATRSVIFRDGLRNLEAVEDGQVRIFGMFGTKITDAIRLENVAIGRDLLGPVSFAILEQRERVGDETVWPVGVLGVDVLSNYRLFAPGDSQELILLRRDDEAPTVPENWARVELRSNPYSEMGQGLKFMDVRLGGRVTSALLDTGSSFNVMTYEFADFPQVQWARKRLHKQYKLNGAVADFKPTIKVERVDLRAGSRIWYDQSFIVKDVSSLEILGIKDQPFMIAGVDFLSDQAFYLDFAANELRMPKGVLEAKSVTGSRVGSQSGTVALAQPGARNR